ncbi:hypothetical protein E4U39_006482 [Claviceps sp. Clav50 group G5]|nr:hypothetical protein E4U39_006482 [Claviceps sp. Clav50 group G5]
MPGSSSERFVVKQQQQQQHGQDSGHRPVPSTAPSAGRCVFSLPVWTDNAGEVRELPRSPSNASNTSGTRLSQEHHAVHESIVLDDIWVQDSGLDRNIVPQQQLGSHPRPAGPSRINPLTTPSAQIVTRRFANIASIPPSISFPHRVERRTGLARVSSPIEQDAADWRQGGG